MGRRRGAGGRAGRPAAAAARRGRHRRAVLRPARAIASRRIAPRSLPGRAPRPRARHVRRHARRVPPRRRRRTLDDLRAALAAFDGCALRDTATNLVFAAGDPTCGLMLVGEAPGRGGPQRQSVRRPVGSVARPHAGQHRPGPAAPSAGAADSLASARRPAAEPGRDADCLPFLHRLIALVAPRRIVLLGPLPARALLGATPMRRRASPVWQDVNIPGHANADPCTGDAEPGNFVTCCQTQRRNAWADLRLLRRSLDTDLTQK